MDIEHPIITEARRTGYPDPTYIEWEREEELRGGEEDAKRTPDEEPADRGGSEDS